MSILINDTDFQPTDTDTDIALAPDHDPEDVDLSHASIAIEFPNSADGRGFSIAAALRRRGYRGRLRARGQILADQYAMARRVGFDEVEIPAELAMRQTQPQWQNRSDWKSHDYQARLGTRRYENE